MAAPIEDSSITSDLDHDDVKLNNTSKGNSASASTMEANSAREATTDFFTNVYDAQCQVSGENSSKLFPSLMSKATTAPLDSPLSNPPPKHVDEDLSAGRVQPLRQSKPKEGTLHEDWLHDHLLSKYPDKDTWRALELFTEDALWKTFPDAKIKAQANDVPGIRPDFVMKHDGRTVVIDAKCISTGYVKWSGVDKLLRDMKGYNASRGALVVRDLKSVSDDLLEYCDSKGVVVVEANRQLGNNLHKVLSCHTPRKPSKELKSKTKNGASDMPEGHYDRGDAKSEFLEPLKKDGTPDMRYKINYDGGDSKSGDLRPSKKDEIPDVRYDANRGGKDASPKDLGPLKKDGTPDMRYKENHDGGDGKSGDLRPSKKDGSPDLKFKAHYDGLDVNSKALGPLKKDGTPDMRYKENLDGGDAKSGDPRLSKKDGSPDLKFKAHYDGKNVNSKAVGPLKKDGTPDMRFKNNNEPKTVTSKTVKKADVVLGYSPSSASFYDGPLKKDGTPDMRYKANYGQVSSSSKVSSSSSGYSGARSYSYSGSASGPLTKSGRPDMRYNANRY